MLFGRKPSPKFEPYPPTRPKPQPSTRSALNRLRSPPRSSNQELPMSLLLRDCVELRGKTPKQSSAAGQLSQTLSAGPVADKARRWQACGGQYLACLSGEGMLPERRALEM